MAQRGRGSHLAGGCGHQLGAVSVLDDIIKGGFHKCRFTFIGRQKRAAWQAFTDPNLNGYPSSHHHRHHLPSPNSHFLLLLVAAGQLVLLVQEVDEGHHQQQQQNAHHHGDHHAAGASLLRIGYSVARVVGRGVGGTWREVERDGRRGSGGVGCVWGGG